MPVYLSISGILNLAGKLATGAPSKSSQVTTLSEALIYLSFYSSLSIRVYGFSEVGIGDVTGSGVTSI